MATCDMKRGIYAGHTEQSTNGSGQLTGSHAGSKAPTARSTGATCGASNASAGTADWATAITHIGRNYSLETRPEGTTAADAATAAQTGAAT